MPASPRPTGAGAALLTAGLAATAAAAQPAPADTLHAPPPPIQDNSFLVEEAYNQDRGVVQHVLTWAKLRAGPGWVGTFTQEWPVGGRRHQLSYTAAEVHPEAARTAPHLGDLGLNYRYQLRDRAGVLVAPRATVVLPTGSARAGAGAGGVGAQALLPVTVELSPRWSAHANAGATLVPRGHDADGAAVRATTALLAGSVVWLAGPAVNLLVEGLWTHDVSRPLGGGPGEASTQRVLSPGVRYALNLRGGAQVVPGVAVPVTLEGSARHPRGSAGLFAYLSVEHPFARTR